MSKDKLTLKERAFVEAYADRNSPTMGNGTQSAKKAGYKGNEVQVAKQASRLVRKVDVEESIKQLFEESGLTDKVITKGIKEIACGNGTYTTIRRDKEGDIIDQTEHGITPNQRLKAYDLVFKRTGAYDDNREQATTKRHVHEKLFNTLLRDYRKGKKLHTMSYVTGKTPGGMG